MKNRWNLLFVFILICVNTNLTAQVNHWETIVFAEDEWHYFVGTSAPPIDWNQTNFDASIWSKGQGGFGYGDDDDNTIIPSTLSVYLTKKFIINSTENIDKLILDADFDDGFVAYLNGQELTRANLGEFGSMTRFNQTTPTDQEARLYRGRRPQRTLFQKNKVEELLRTGENTLAIEVHNVNETSSDLSSNFYLSLGKTDEELEYFLPPDWFEVPVEVEFTSSNLPIMVIETEGQQAIPDEPKITAKMGLIYNENARNELTNTYNDYDGFIGIERRGSSSQSFPKVGYGFETREEDGSNNNVKLLGMPKENDWVLHGPYSDKSLIRNALAYTIGRELMDYAPRVRFCELVINGDYQGVYLLTEKIKRDNNRVDINNLKDDENSGDDLTGGYILKIDKFTGGNNGSWTSDYPAQDNIDFDINFQYDVPSADEITSEQMNYIQNYIGDFEDALADDNFMDAEEGYRKYINTETFIRFWIINELAKNVDGYRLSTYFHKDKNSIGPKIRMGPIWDFNLGFGNADYCTSGNPEGWVYNQFNEICPQDGVPIPFWWKRLLEDPDFQIELIENWRTLRQTELSTENILAKVDSMQTLLVEAQRRNFERWEVLGNYVWPNFFVGNTYEEEMTWLKNWLRDRLNWMDNNIDFLLPTFSFLPNQSSEVFPNPFQKQLTITYQTSTTIAGVMFYITDITGKVVYSEQLDLIPNQVNYSIDFQSNELADGIYFYRLEKEEFILASGKIVKK